MSTLEQSLETLENNLESRYKGLVLWTSFLSGGDEYHAPIVRIMTVQIPSENRKQGLGSEVMSQIISWADNHGVMLSLSPSTDFGASSVSRLTKFYRRFGFKPNKGRNKDFRTRDTMLRNPILRKNSSRRDTSYKMPRKWDKEHCESKSCDEMGFSEKASCRPYIDCYGGKTGSSSSHMNSRVASRYLRSAQRDDPKLKNTGHGGLSTWFAGHGGGKPDERATWGDWIAITPIKHTVKKDGESKTYEPGDIVGPCAISSQPSWRSVTDGGENPLKCMPRDKAHDLTKEQRATLARKKRREESKGRNTQKPVFTPTFSEEGKNMLNKKAVKLFVKAVGEKKDMIKNKSAARPIRIDKRALRGLTDQAWNLVVKRAELIEKAGLSNIGQVEPLRFRVGEFKVGDVFVPVFAEINEEKVGEGFFSTAKKGGGSIHSIVIYISNHSISILDPRVRKYVDFESKFKKNFLSVLEHEMTHAYDKILYHKNMRGYSPFKDKGQDPFTTPGWKNVRERNYVNHSGEVKAHLQQIASQSEEYLRNEYGLSRESIKDHFMESLENSRTYRRINTWLTPKNRKYIKSAVLTHLLDQVV